jgi:hypothetical protein
MAGRSVRTGSGRDGEPPPRSGWMGPSRTASGSRGSGRPVRRAGDFRPEKGLFRDLAKPRHARPGGGRRAHPHDIRAVDERHDAVRQAPEPGKEQGHEKPAVPTQRPAVTVHHVPLPAGGRLGLPAGAGALGACCIIHDCIGMIQMVVEKQSKYPPHLLSRPSLTPFMQQAPSPCLSPSSRWKPGAGHRHRAFRAVPGGSGEASPGRVRRKGRPPSQPSSKWAMRLMLTAAVNAAVNIALMACFLRSWREGRPLPVERPVRGGLPGTGQCRGFRRRDPDRRACRTGRRGQCCLRGDRAEMAQGA